jgi:hypothetical protein
MVMTLLPICSFIKHSSNRYRILTIRSLYWNGFIIQRPTCIMCGIGDMEEMLMVCSECGARSAHSFCLDPPLPPPAVNTLWFCGRCSQRRRYVACTSSFLIISSQSISFAEGLLLIFLDQNL